MGLGLSSYWLPALCGWKCIICDLILKKPTLLSHLVHADILNEIHTQLKETPSSLSNHQKIIEQKDQIHRAKSLIGIRYLSKINLEGLDQVRKLRINPDQSW